MLILSAYRSECSNVVILTQYSPRPHQKRETVTKLDPHLPFTPLSRRNLKYLENFPVLVKQFYTPFYGGKVSFPVFPSINERELKFICKAQSQKSLSVSLELRFHWLVLCYISVHFAILWCSCQIFPLNESFNALFDDYRTREESCSQLLGYLERQSKYRSSQHAMLYFTSNIP